MHSAIADIQRMGGRHCAFAHDCCDNRNIFFFHKFLQLLSRMADVDTSAGKNQRFLCRLKHFISFLQLSDMYPVNRLISTDIHMGRVLCRSGCRLDILWNINQYRSRFPGLGDIKCHLNNLSEVFPSSHRHTILSNASRHTNNVHFLKCIISDQSKWHLSGKTNQRNAVIMGICQSGNDIGRSRSARYQTYAHPSGRLGISFRLMNQSLLMPRQDQVDTVSLI